jgi:hypothetical protein
MKENEMGGTVARMGEMEIHTILWLGNVKQITGKTYA